MTTGPFASERDARDAAMKALANTDALSLLTGACGTAGVELGRYDRITLDWLSQWEPSTVAVVAGLITRAHEAGRAPAPEAAGTEWAVRWGNRTIRVASEDEARALNTGHAMRREVGPWKEADDG